MARPVFYARCSLCRDGSEQATAACIIHPDGRMRSISRPPTPRSAFKAQPYGPCARQTRADAGDRCRGQVLPPCWMPVLRALCPCRPPSTGNSPSDRMLEALDLRRYAQPLLNRCWPDPLPRRAGWRPEDACRQGAKGANGPRMAGGGLPPQTLAIGTFMAAMHSDPANNAPVNLTAGQPADLCQARQPAPSKSRECGAVGSDVRRRIWFSALICTASKKRIQSARDQARHGLTWRRRNPRPHGGGVGGFGLASAVNNAGSARCPPSFDREQAVSTPSFPCRVRKLWAR